METLKALCRGYLPAGDELVPPGWLDLTPILGVWRNLDHGSAGVASLALSRDGERLLVRARGGAGSLPGDWGEVPATASGASSTATGTMAFSAVYDLGHLTSTLAGYTRQGLLVLDTLYSFRDSSGRADQFSRDYLRFEGGAALPPRGSPLLGVAASGL